MICVMVWHQTGPMMINVSDYTHIWCNQETMRSLIFGVTHSKTSENIIRWNIAGCTSYAIYLKSVASNRYFLICLKISILILKINFVADIPWQCSKNWFTVKTFCVVHSNVSKLYSNYSANLSADEMVNMQMVLCHVWKAVKQLSRILTTATHNVHPLTWHCISLWVELKIDLITVKHLL